MRKGYPNSEYDDILKSLLYVCMSIPKYNKYVGFVARTRHKSVDIGWNRKLEHYSLENYFKNHNINIQTARFFDEYYDSDRHSKNDFLKYIKNFPAIYKSFEKKGCLSGLVYLIYFYFNLKKVHRNNYDTELSIKIYLQVCEIKKEVRDDFIKDLFETDPSRFWV